MTNEVVLNVNNMQKYCSLVVNIISYNSNSLYFDCLELYLQFLKADLSCLPFLATEIQLRNQSDSLCVSILRLCSSKGVPRVRQLPHLCTAGSTKMISDHLL